MRPRRNFALQAFTLLEIMLVVAIISLLLGAGFVALRGQIDVAREARMKADFQALKTGLDTYENFNGFLPTTEQGLAALITMPTTEPKPSHWHQAMERPLKDPFGNEYVYVFPGKHNPKGYDLVSKGKDHILGTEDDYGDWQAKE